jgi:molybdate transport system substrate-binding protein
LAAYDAPVSEEPVTIMLAAAASLKNITDNELIPAFEKSFSNIKVEATYDSSGKLQAQIEAGLAADIFFSAATKQMDALAEKGLVDPQSVIPLLENKLALITPAEGGADISGFETITNANIIAIGDPESVPAGQYAQEVFTSLGIWDAVLEKASLGTNVTEVLTWVAEGSADAGVVYATDAVAKEHASKISVIAVASEGLLKQPIIYPVGLVSSSTHKDAAQALLQFLLSDAAKSIFESYGFSVHG